MKQIKSFNHCPSFHFRMAFRLKNAENGKFITFTPETSNKHRIESETNSSMRRCRLVRQNELMTTSVDVFYGKCFNYEFSRTALTFYTFDRRMNAPYDVRLHHHNSRLCVYIKRNVYELLDIGCRHFTTTNNDTHVKRKRAGRKRLRWTVPQATKIIYEFAMICVRV